MISQYYLRKWLKPEGKSGPAPSVRPQAKYVSRFLNRLVVDDGHWYVEGKRATLKPTVAYAVEKDFDSRGSYRHCTPASRLSYYWFHRVPWSELDGLQVRHLCGDTRCVNPSHLTVGTGSENQLDRNRPPEELLRLMDESKARLRLQENMNGHSVTIFPQ